MKRSFIYELNILISATKLSILFMSPARFTAWILAVFSLPALSISDRCSGGSILHRFKDNSERCCQNVTVPPGHERRICKEENGKAEYAKCSSHTYQSNNYSSVVERYCNRHSECPKPNMVVDVPGNSTSNTLCKCNEAEGYRCKNLASATATLEPYHCLLDRSSGSRKGTSNITSTTIAPSDTTESPSNTTETAETVSHPVSKITVGVIAIIVVIAVIAIVFAAFIVKKRRRNNSACQQFRRNQGGPNGAQTTVNIMDGENCPLDICTDGHEEGDAVDNGHVTSNGACLHSTPLMPGLSETDELQNIVDLHEDVDSSLCAQSNSTEFQNKKIWIDKRYIS